ncbi:MAG: hypothetical protein A3G41_02210 [Elusimicrobia bacterium RIFCSPLOWO2_12_FULL_59_9]|nr:MAG: hypothetical protein A3G41_02210 [Elusimicrobia bacterium RIFCSPLOWO2_12_FULL_59_9]
MAAHAADSVKEKLKSYTKSYVEQITSHLKGLDLEILGRIAEVLEGARKEGRQVLIIGNGGSAATASHMANDLAKTAAVKGQKRIKAIALTDNVPIITAIGNDMSYDDVFSEQLDFMVSAGDVVILISGSGNSPNVVKAAQLARQRGAVTIGLLGFSGGKLKSMVDYPLHIASDHYGVVEDIHLSINHILAWFFKQNLS